MRYALVGKILLITATVASADHRPALTWEGEVSGTAILKIQGDRIDVDDRSAASVSRTNYRFTTPLAAAPDRITVEEREGAARVRVLEQPRRNNDFTAVVEVTPRNRRSRFVALDFYWEDRGLSSRNQDRGYGTRSRTNDRMDAPSAGNARWSGEIDNEVFILFRGRQVFNTAVRGRSVYGQQIDIPTPLPRRPVTVMLQDIQGRGQVELAEQPDQNNNFTAKVRIVDPQNGSGAYSFTLAWDESGAGSSNSGAYSSGGGILTPNGGNATGVGSVRWAGQVDGRIRISFRGNQAFAQRISGGEISRQQVNFASGIPRRNLDLEINKLRGRGDVNVVERPSVQNNYTAVVEIDDSDSGSDVYEFELNWR